MSIYEKLAKMSNQQLKTTWEALSDYDSYEMYDAANNISMDNWAEAVYSEMDRRGIPHFK